MNNNIINLLNNINALQTRMNNIKKLSVSLQPIQHKTNKKYGLYVVPVNTNLFPDCGKEWGGPHITIAGFTTNNKDKIESALKYIKDNGEKNKRWKPDLKSVKVKHDRYGIESDTLDKLRDYLAEVNVENLKGPKSGDEWHLTCTGGVPGGTTDVLKNTKWWLLMIEKDGNDIKWQWDNKVAFYNISQPIKQQQQPIKVLSYNISYQAMEGKAEKGVTYECPMQDGYTECLKNVAKFIEDNGPFDFIGLQEGTNWNQIKNTTPKLKDMQPISNKPGEEMVTFFDKNKYQLDDGVNIINTFMATHGRPCTIIFFKQKICIINIHADHKNDIENFDKYLIDTLTKEERTYLSKNQNKTINSKKFQINNSPGLKPRYEDLSGNILKQNEIIEKLKTYKIIMLGDFNSNLGGGQTYTIFKDPFYNNTGGRKLYGINKTNTCCNADLQTTKTSVNSAIDHILSTSDKIQSIVYDTNLPASDHLPIIATIIL